MQPLFPARLVVIAALITVIAFFAASMVFYFSYKDAVLVGSSSALSQSQSGDILLFDEQLTSSALLAAHSGDPIWIDRYLRVENKLIESINAALSSAGSTEVRKAATLTNEANAALVKMEYRSFELVKNGESKEAVALFSSDDYLEQKALYIKGMGAMVESIDRHRDAVQTRVRDRVQLLVCIVSLCFLITTGIWIHVYSALQKWRSRIAVEEQLRSVAEAQVQALNAELEIRVHERTKELKDNQAKLAYQANYDDLTGLANRRHVLRHLRSLLNSKTEFDQISVLLIDLDNFKRVNDSLGHAAGDRLLVEAANRLGEVTHSSDFVARLGGDEFLIVSQATAGRISQADQPELADRIIESFNVPFVLGEQNYALPISPSIGIALVPENGVVVEDIVQNADTAMYAAKQSGRNTACYFKDEMDATNRQRLAIEAKLRTALNAGNQFQLYYQPQVDLATQLVVGVEALIRWPQPEGGFIVPDVFIPIAEDTGLISSIGNWVLDEAARQARKWRLQYGIDLTISINVTSRQLEQPCFTQIVKDTFEQYETIPTNFGIEITESSLIGNDPVTRDNLKTLSTLGIQISMDDFGTGYSALSYLKQYPFDLLKIDRSFIQSIVESRVDASLVEGIISMSNSIGLRVVAEGVETLEQSTLVQTLGCDIAQGYFYGKPDTNDALVEFLAMRGQLLDNHRRATS